MTPREMLVTNVGLAVFAVLYAMPSAPRVPWGLAVLGAVGLALTAGWAGVASVRSAIKDFKSGRAEEDVEA